MTHVHLDTDIGSDVDDALALALLLGSPEIQLTGISTVYGDTLLRARLASRIARTARPHLDIPIASGTGTPRSGREVWWAGHEGRLHADLEREDVVSLSGVDMLTRNAAAQPGAIDLLAIGPLTNVADALDHDQSFQANTPRVVIMGGDFGPNPAAEHNIVCDVVAAERVLASDLQLVFGGLDLTQQVRLEPDDVDKIGGAGDIGDMLRAEISEWWRFHGNAWSIPHDPLVALWLISPEIFTVETRHVTLDVDGVFHTVQPGAENGRAITVITGVDSRAAREEMVQRITAAHRLVHARP